MKFRYFLAYAVCVGIIVGALYSRAQPWQPLVRGTPPLPSGSYTGPGDTQAWDLWWGEIAYNAAYASAQSAVGTVTRASDSATCVVKFGTNGKPNLTTGIPCTSGTQTVTQFCNATTCSWTAFVNQGTGAANSLTQGTLASAPTLTLTACPSLTGMVTCAHFVNASTQFLTSASTLGQPHAPPYTFLVVARMTGTPQSENLKPLQLNGGNDLISDITTFGYFCSFVSTQSSSAIPSTSDGNWYVLINTSGSSGYCGASTNSTPNAVTSSITNDTTLTWGADNIPAHGWDGDMLAAGVAFTGITGTVSSGNVQAIVSNLRATAGF